MVGCRLSTLLNLYTLPVLNKLKLVEFGACALYGFLGCNKSYKNMVL